MLQTVTNCRACSRTHSIEFKASNYAIRCKGGYTHMATCPDSGLRLIWGFRSAGYAVLDSFDLAIMANSNKTGQQVTIKGIEYRP